MKICMVTPHIPPYQSANAILPRVLASKLKDDGHEVLFIIPEKALTDSGKSFEFPVKTVKTASPKRVFPRFYKLSSIFRFFSVYRQMKNNIIGADVIHLHSNGIIHQAAAFAAGRNKIPFVLTHYGTEIWHHRPKRKFVPDIFEYMNNKAEYVTYYSKLLMEHSLKIRIKPKKPLTIYPPVGDDFRQISASEKTSIRRQLGMSASNILVNVKRLHPLGGHEYLLKAMPFVLSRHPDTQLFVCGTGELRKELEKLKDKLGLQGKVIFTGMVDNDVIWKYYAAADLYVLSSVLEALPTVVVEALACGTPVVMTDTPGGLELCEIFPKDITVVEMHNPEKMGEAINSFLSKKRRTSKSTLETVNKIFRTDKVYKQYLELYLKSVGNKHCDEKR